MKNRILLAGMIMITAVTLGQKKEIKKAEKAIKNGEGAEALAMLKTAESLMPNADNELKAQYYAAMGEAQFLDAGSDLGKLKASADSFKMANDLNPDSKVKAKMDVAIQNLKVTLERGAVDDFNAKNYKDAAERYLAIYKVSPSDTLFLYNAALAGKNGKLYDQALGQFNQLLDMGYTGIVKQYVATNKETGKEEFFQTTRERDLVVKFGTHEKPGINISESKQDDILRGITSIYMDKGDTEKGLELLEGLIADNPDDDALLGVAAGLYYKMGDLDKFNAITKKLIAKNPNDSKLYFNLGVTSAASGNNEEAKKYYEKAVELKPDYQEAIVNIASLLLGQDQKIQEELNNLGTSKADDLKYDQLKAERKGLYTEALPYLEKSFNLKEDLQIGRTLVSLYSYLGEDAKLKNMKAKVEAMEGGQ